MWVLTARGRWVMVCVALAVLGSWSRVARAEPPFPEALRDAAGMPCIPACVTCHTSQDGGASTWAQKPFGYAMAARGLSKGSGAAGVAKAFEAFKADPTDPAKTAAAVNALQSGRDPDNGNDVCIGPTYGCGAHIVRQASPLAPAQGWWVVGVVAAGALLRRRLLA